MIHPRSVSSTGSADVAADMLMSMLLLQFCRRGQHDSRFFLGQGAPSHFAAMILTTR